MTPELQQQLTSLLSLLQQGIERGTEAGLTELPVLAQQLIQWKIAENIFWAAIGLAGFLFSLWWVRFCYRKARRENDEDWIALGSLSLIGFAPSLLLFIAISNLLQLLIAPQIYLIEYIARLL